LRFNRLLGDGALYSTQKSQAINDIGLCVNSTDRALEDAIQRIAADNQSGALEILKAAADVFAAVPSDAEASDLIRICANLARAQPAMAPLVNLASGVVSEATREGARPSVSAASAARRFVNAAATGALDLSRLAAGLITERSVVLTHSRSSTVLSALMEAKHRGTSFNVIATESRPLLEGRKLAGELAAASVPVTLIADCAVAALLTQASIVFVGADRVTPSDVVNKIGTRLIALAAQDAGVPIYSLCDSSKFLNSDIPGQRVDTHSLSEIWDSRPSGVLAFNSYFESTPIGLFTAIVTEGGLLASSDAQHLARSRTIHPALARALSQFL